MGKHLKSFRSLDILNESINDKTYTPPFVGVSQSTVIYEKHPINWGLFIDNKYPNILNRRADFYKLLYKYENSDNKSLDYFLPFDGNTLKSTIEFNFAPYEAAKIGVYDNNKRIGEIELGSLKQNFGERKYRVGLMSDIHYNDSTIDMETSTYTDDGAEYHNDIINAFNYYQNNEEIEFICAAGDVSTDEVKHLLNFKKMLNEYAPTTNFYSCLGNHDFKCTAYDIQNPVSSSYNDMGLSVEDKNRLQIWNSIITPTNSKYELHYQDSTTEYGKTSYWFEVPLEGTNKSDIYVFLSVNYGYGNYTSTANQNLTEESPNIQPLIDYVGYMPSSYNIQFYDNLTLIWLKDLLEQFNNKRIFIFTHQFFSHKAGNCNISEGHYQYARDYWRITPTSAYCLCGIQFEFLNKLNNEYKNTIWFTGHSHYKWNWQTIDKEINICNNEYSVNRPGNNDFNEYNRYLRYSYDPISKTGINVHLPSTCRPLKISSGYDVAGSDSEGAIMDIYENYVDIRGIIFKENSNEYVNKYYPISQYRINIPAA